MLKKLRRRLTLIFTLFTGAVLAGVLGLSLYTVLQREMADTKKAFSLQAGLVLSQLGGQNGGEETKDEVVVESAPYLLLVKKDGEALPLVQEAGWQPRTPRAVLFERAKEAADSAEYQAAMTGGYTQGVATASAAADAVEGNAASGASTASTRADGVLEDAAAGADAASEDKNGVTFDISDLPNSTGEPWQAEGAAPAGDVTAVSAQAAAIESTNAASEPSYVITIMGAEQTEGSEVFSLCGDAGDEYFAGRYFFSEPNASAEYEVLLLQDLSGQNRSFGLWYLGYAALFLGGLALLLLINWLLAKLVLRPTAAAMQQQTDFVAAASHELRSPLAVVRSSLSARRAAENEQEAQKYERAAEAEAARMGRLVEDLLLLAGGDAGRWQLRRETVDMDTLLIEASERYMPLAAKRGLSLRLSLPEETLPPFAGDRDRLGQILNILLDNALQYAPPGSEVVLGAKLQKSKLALQVEDHGPGVADADKPRLFERFYRADESRADKEHFGLGLSVAKELAEMHGGQLLVQDTPGGGATFTLLLPRRFATS